MEIREAIYRRRSIRAFTSEPVAKKTLLHLLDAAIQAPSARNLQPWQFVVVTGKARERLAQKLASRYAEDLARGVQAPVMALAEPYQSRVNRFMESLKIHTSQAAHFDLMSGSLNFYGAPAVILLALDKSLSSDRLFDLGAAVQNFLLLAPSQGLGTCVIGIALRYRDLIRAELQLPESINLVMTIAVGVPDPASPLSTFQPGRQDPTEFLTWIE
jgi:nitroreductase